MVNRHMPTSLRLIPRPSNWADSVNTCTEVFSNWRFRRRRSGLNPPFENHLSTGKDTVAKRSSAGKDYERSNRMEATMRLQLSALI